MEPCLRAVNRKQDYRDQVSRLVVQRQTLVEKSEEKVKGFWKSQTDTQGQIDDCQKAIEVEKDGEKERRKELARTEQQISNLERQMREKPLDFDAAAYNEQIRSKKQQVREFEDRADEIQRELRDNSSRAAEKKDLITRAERDLQHLRSQAGQQIERLKGISPDTATAWRWLQDNRNLFGGRVYGPPIVECSVKDPKYADFVESVLQNSDLLAFTCTSREDFNKLQKSLYGDLKLSDVTIRSAVLQLDAYQPPVSREQLEDYGLESYVLDHLSGPAPRAFCAVRRVENTRHRRWPPRTNIRAVLQVGAKSDSDLGRREAVRCKLAGDENTDLPLSRLAYGILEKQGSGQINR